MVLHCKCGRIQAVTTGKRFMIYNWIAPLFIGGCKGCGTWWIWIFGKGWEIKRI